MAEHDVGDGFGERGVLGHATTVAARLPRLVGVHRRVLQQFARVGPLASAAWR